MRMRIGLATTYDVNKPEKWNKECTGNWGASIYIKQSLEKDAQIECLGPVSEDIWLFLFTRLKRFYYKWIKGQNYYIWANPSVCKSNANQIENRLKKENYDLILCTETLFIASYLQTDIPIVLWIDSSLFSLIGLYSYFTNLCEETKQDISCLESQAMNKAKLIIVTSDWAKKSIIDLYGISDIKIQVIPRGANLQITAQTENSIYRWVKEKRKDTVCRLLFSGVDWERKGGDIALQIVLELNKRGIPSILVVVGCNPIVSSQYVQSYGFINKFKDGDTKMINIILSCHFLILPTKIDTNPHALSEANSLGVPCLTSDIMGISSVIRDNANGYTFNPEASIEEYCQVIIDYFTDKDKYEWFAMSSFNEYKTRLNWDVGIEKALNLFNHMAQNK